MNLSSFRVAFLVLVSLTGGFMPILAYATSDANVQLPYSDLSLEKLMQVQTVTSASRFEQSTTDAPSAVSVLTSQDIREYGWRTLADALASLPGLYVSNDRNYSYLGARGFLPPGDYNTRFLLLIDGIRTNDNVYDQALIGTEGLLDMDLVERIEYVPGPGAAVYGSNALFGVINVITKSGSALNGVRAAQSFGSLSERRSQLSYGWHSQDGSDVLLSASTYHRRGDDLYFAEFDTTDQNHGVARALDWDRAQNLFAKLHRRGLTFTAGYVGRTKGVATASFGAVFNAPNKTRDAQVFANLAYDTSLTPDLAVSSSLLWGRADYLGVGLYPDDDGGARINVDGDHGAWYGASSHMTYSGLPNHKMIAGIEVQKHRRRDQFNYDIDPYALVLNDQRNGSRYAAFIENEWRVTDTTILNGGVRYDREAGIRRGKVSPRLAMIQTVSPKDTIKVIYGTAFRTPNAYEQYYAIPGAGGQTANPDLHPEDIQTQELVWEHRPDAYAKVSLSLFRYQMHNLITQVEDPATELLHFSNTARANARGVDLAGERAFANRLQIRANYSWQRSGDGNGHGLVNSPKHLLKIGVSMPWAVLGARLAGEGQCASQRLTANAQVSGFCNVNIVLSSASAVGGFQWSLALYNALDRAYADPAGPAFVQEAIARERRTIMVKIGYGF